MIQKLIPNDGDFRIIVIKNNVELVIKRKLTNDKEFRSNVALGGKAVKADVPQEIKNMCVDISKHISCDILGFDIIQDLTDGKYYVMEINVSPHMATFCVVSGINLPEIITNHIVSKINVNNVNNIDNINMENN
jgi:glutathione synthase/RimK-type ligase-like ATP-grasp enzyme